MSVEFKSLFNPTNVPEPANKVISAFCNKIINGVVTKIDSAYVYVDAGFKSEGLIARREVAHLIDESGNLSLKVGDTIEVVMVSPDTGYGDAQLSVEQAITMNWIAKLQHAKERDEPVEGLVTGRVKGGFTVAFGPVTAFLPGSLVDLGQAKDLNALEGTKQMVKVVKLNAKRNNIVVSRRAALDPSHAQGVEDLISSLSEGQIVSGTVKNITDYGVFVDIGGVDGLLHITDMAWKRIKQASDVVHVGEVIKVKVLKFDRETRRISLGMKQLSDDPWTTITEIYKPGSRLKGRVTAVTDYGAFVEMGHGLVEGLVHLSAMDWTNKTVHPSKVVHQGQEIDVQVLEIDQEKRRVSLGMKQCVPNPWLAFSNQFMRGDKIKGLVKSITDFGVFIGLPGNIDGLIHYSDLSATDPGEVAVRQFKKGDEVEAVILAIDPDKERISLGIKQLNTDLSELPPVKTKSEVHHKEVVERPKVATLGSLMQDRWSEKDDKK